MFISALGITFKYSFLLTFECAINTTKYEALILGLDVAIKHGIKCLKVHGDSQLIIAQVRSRYDAKDERLKLYKHVVWDRLEFLEAFNLLWVERSNNIMLDFLANAALKNNDITLTGVSMLEIKSRLVVPDNIHNWQVFEDDFDILSFLQGLDTYDGKQIDFNEAQ